MNNITNEYMNDMTDKEWYDHNKSFITRKGAVFNINNNHHFGVVSNGKMTCFKTHSFEIFKSTGRVNALLNDKHFQTLAELHETDNVNTCFSFNTLYKAQECIEEFKKEYELNGNENISFQVELSIGRRTYLPWRRNKDNIQTSSSHEFHYCFDEAIKENPKNKVFKHWEEERKSMNFATKEFDSEVFFDSRKDGAELTDEKIEEIRNSIVERFNAYTTEQLEKNKDELSCNSVLNGILDFEWDNKNDNIKHWNSLNLYCKDRTNSKEIFYEVHNDSFSIQLSNNIKDFFMSSFGFVNYDIDVTDNKIIAKSNTSKDIIKVDNVMELMTEMNKKLGEILLKDSNEKENDFFNIYSLPMKKLKTLKTHYNLEKGIWKIENISQFSKEGNVTEEISEILNEYSEQNWNKDIIKEIKLNNTLPYREKMALYNIIKDFLIENKYICEDFNYYDHLKIKTLNFIFELE